MNARSAQVLAAFLGVLLIVLIGALVFFLLSRPPQGPAASATPTAVAAASPGTSSSPSPLPTFSAFPSLSPGVTLEPFPSPTAAVTPEVTPELTPQITPEVTPEITPVVPTPVPTITLPPTPTPSPTPLIPTSPDREIRFRDMGLDARNETGIQRFLLFTTDGPSLIQADISNATANARVCLWEGDDVENQECITTRPNGTLSHPTFGAGSAQWTLTVIARSTTAAATADVTLDFNAHAPAIDYENFRFQGVPVPGYNGWTAAIDVSPGSQVGVAGQFDGSQQHMWRVQIDAAGEGNVQDQTGGPSNSFSVSQSVSADTTFLITVSNPNTSAEPLPVFVHGTISWT